MLYICIIYVRIYKIGNSGVNVWIAISNQGRLLLINIHEENVLGEGCSNGSCAEFLEYISGKKVNVTISHGNCLNL